MTEKELKILLVDVLSLMNYAEYKCVIDLIKQKGINADDIFIDALKEIASRKDDNYTYKARIKIKKLVEGIQNPKPVLSLEETLKLIGIPGTPQVVNNKLIRLTTKITDADYQNNYNILHPYFNTIKKVFKETNSSENKLLNELNKEDVITRIKNKGSGCGPELTELSASDFNNNIRFFSMSAIMTSKKAVKFLANNPEHMKIFLDNFMQGSQSPRAYYKYPPLPTITKYIQDPILVRKFLSYFTPEQLVNTSLLVSAVTHYNANTMQYETDFISFKKTIYGYNGSTSTIEDNIKLIKQYVLPMILNENVHEIISKNIDLLLEDDGYKYYRLYKNNPYYRACVSIENEQDRWYDYYVAYKLLLDEDFEERIVR